MGKEYNKLKKDFMSEFGLHLDKCNGFYGKGYYVAKDVREIGSIASKWVGSSVDSAIESFRFLRENPDESEVTSV